MITLGLISGKKYSIKGHASEIDSLIRGSSKFIEVTLIKTTNSGGHSGEEEARFLISSIAYWY